MDGSTLEWSGATTFRLKTKGLLTIFLDAWLERPASLDQYLSVDEVDECDYIFISHAHFDHLPSADRIAKETGAIPESQLAAISGGERIPLFIKEQRHKVIVASSSRPHGLPSGPPSGPPGPPTPNPDDAIITVHAWPSLHALMPLGDHRSFPEVMDTGTVYTGSGSHSCTLDVTRGLTYGLGGLLKMDLVPPQMHQDMKDFVTYMKDRDMNRYSFFDGGQIMYNFLIDGKALLWNGHLGGYEGILKEEPDFAVKEVQWIGEPSKVTWCLHDRCPINPKHINVAIATERVEEGTKSKVIELTPAQPFRL
ncbi:hypothetical protein P152DRAFT_469148 [Eremomyces bilateralis CBS 781.70]|uniref:Metallo-beta-lactamase domain-containing protein n=1 Tax=Eremomyces bilateralis CBS 781.70 TaxID=1392243 RepID=A0A6G1FR60_9PEZI|nr:uncharacterized protein P152DRAFT_469148 [Eremomyces bilateralis CBS 781.70]KAF1808152.1 hypothetical protein P152DRAFT_469148 [Eremomyces bilateralis CBS 781.70]